MKHTFAKLSIAATTLSLAACSSLAPSGAASTAPNPKLATLVGPGQLAHSSLPPSLQAIDPRMGRPRSMPTPIPRSEPYYQSAGAYQYPVSMGQLAVGDVDCPSSCPPIHLPTAPRVMLPTVQGVEHPAPSAELYPDEYICDGGDEGLPTSVAKDGTVTLQFEETVGTFLDDDATRHVEPSNRVCVYAPSFAAVRTISRPITDHKVDKIAGIRRDSSLVGFEAPLGVLTGAKFDTGMETRVRSRPSEVDVDRSDSLMASATSTEKHVLMLNVFQEYNFLGDNELTAGTIAVIQEGLDAAVAWQQNDVPVIVGRDESLNQVRGQVVAQEYFDYEDRREDGDLLLIKTADKRSAKPGEEVEFAIRYDNKGGKSVFDVTIIDHLSPRLELVPGSVEIDRAAEVVVEDDYEGSVYLKVRLNEPLDAKSGGVVTFKCRVRK